MEGRDEGAAAPEPARPPARQRSGSARPAP